MVPKEETTPVCLSMTNLTLEIPHSFYAKHHWPDAPEQVAFLRIPHSHYFWVTLTLSVTGDDREVEFYLAQEDLVNASQSLLANWTLTWSCEQIAKAFYEQLRNAVNFDHSQIRKIKVSEDKLFSATVEFG